MMAPLYVCIPLRGFGAGLLLFDLSASYVILLTVLLDNYLLAVNILLCYGFSSLNISTSSSNLSIISFNCG